MMLNASSTFQAAGRVLSLIAVAAAVAIPSLFV
jgi:hypothetical protein